jgi:hypothetical protein
MSVPDWWEFALLALAAWRVFQLIAEDEILNGPRRYVTSRLSEKWELFIECPYCAGFWIALAWWAAWQIEDEWTLIVAVPWALSAGVIGAAKILSPE